MGDIRNVLYSLKENLKAEHNRYTVFVQSRSELPLSVYAKLQEDMRKYICLRCSGFLEQLMFETVSWYIENNAAPESKNFALSFFRHSPNLSPTAFESLLERFGETKLTSFRSTFDELNRSILGNMLDTRNNVAHGLPTRGQKYDAKAYVDLCEEIYDWVLDEFVGPYVHDYSAQPGPR
jgi:hypothetical protein